MKLKQGNIVKNTYSWDDRRYVIDYVYGYYVEIFDTASNFQIPMLFPKKNLILMETVLNDV